MSKSIEVAGIRLDNCTAREMIAVVTKELSDQGLHTIQEVNTDTLVQAASDETVRAVLTAAEHTVISEAAILEAVGEATYQRRREVENHDFFHELMRLIERNHKKVCIIGDDDLAELLTEARIRALFPRCEIVAYTLEQFDGTTDSVVNEVNAAAPYMILSILPSPAQEYFFQESRGKLSAKLWYGIGKMDPTPRKNGIFGMIYRRVRARKLAKQLRSLSQERVEDEQS